METLLHICLPSEQSYLLQGLPLILPGWTEEEMDGDITLEAWERLPEKKRQQIQDAGEVIR